MANSDTARSRAPRGTKSVTDAFFSALHELPEIRQSEVAKAAQIAIRDVLKLARDKAKAAKLAARARVAPAGKKMRAKPIAKKATPAAKKLVTSRKPRAASVAAAA
ncbi:MAG TPA: hypothetical protein VGH36_03535 [Acetobacteraceae bacterium]|jgi:hypothetical protein